MLAALSGATFGRRYYLSSAPPDRSVDSFFNEFGLCLIRSIAILAACGFLSTSSILRPEPSQGSLQVGQKRFLASCLRRHTRLSRSLSLLTPYGL